MMLPRRNGPHVAAALFAAVLAVGQRPAGGEALRVGPGESVVFLGNAFVERMRLFGYFETFLHCRFPDHKLRVRYMGWSADEVDRQIRPHGFPKLFDELETLQAGLIFVCFGLNESFQGPERVNHFRGELNKFVAKLQSKTFNGKTPPRIVLVSPIAFEPTGGDGARADARNRILERYVEAVAQTAKDQGAAYVNLFVPTRGWRRENPQEKLTFNGIHVTESGDRIVSRMLARALGWDAGQAGRSRQADAAQAFRRLVYEKNYHFSQWWHPPNASYIHGRRKRTRGALHLKAERKQRLLLIEEQDRRIWAGKKIRPADVWARAPVEGRPIWHPTPNSRPIPGTDKQPQGAVKSDGKPDRGALRPDEQLKQMSVPKGYRVNLYASEVRFPLANPMAIHFDNAGRLWVANTPTWPHSLPGRQPRDSVVILSDTNRDGVADKHTVFADRLNLLHGFVPFGDGAFLAQTPRLIHARDTDGDGVADWMRTVLHGFGAEDAEHAMNNFRFRPDGSIYFTQGIFYNTQVETPYGPVRVRDAAVFRYRPIEHRLDVYASHHFWNPYGNVFGRWGRGIVLDASAGQYYPMDVLSTNFEYPKRKRRANHLSLVPGGSIAAGCEYLYSRHFPPEVQGRLLVNHCEGDRGTQWYGIKERGTGYELEAHKPALLTSRDPRFRPVAMAIGPDGALYVADFYTHIFENVNFSKRHPGRDHSRGRIWRISCEGRPLLKPPKIAGQPVPALLDLLKRPEATTREFARRELQRRGRAAVLPHLAPWQSALRPDDPKHAHHLVEALWLHQSLNHVDRKLLDTLLSHPNAPVRMAATQVLRFWQNDLDESLRLLRRGANDPDPRVRLYAVLACGFSASDKPWEAALEAARHGLDDGLRHALGQTIDYLERRELRRGRPQPQLRWSDPQVVRYQLGRLSGNTLVRIKRQTDETKYRPVYEALLVRPGLPRPVRDEALKALSALNRTSPGAELLAAIERLDRDSLDKSDVLHELGTRLAMTPAADLRGKRARLASLAGKAKRAPVRRAAFAGLVVADGGVSRVWPLVRGDPDRRVDLMDCLSLIGNPKIRDTFYPHMEPLLREAAEKDIRAAAIRNISYLGRRQDRTFVTLARLLDERRSRESAILSLRRLNAAACPADEISPLAKHLVKYARSVPGRRRDSDVYFAALSLIGDLAGRLPRAESVPLRRALRKLGVQVFQIRPVYAQMRYDRTEIVVEAGASVLIVFLNDDIMPHNLLITAPGAREQVGAAAEAMAARPGAYARGYVPESDKVLWATKLLAPGTQAKLSFRAPKKPGRYPYVCTFPGHWRTMFGTLLVVKDLDAHHKAHPTR